jgi:hypothetical protein
LRSVQVVEYFPAKEGTANGADTVNLTAN